MSGRIADEKCGHVTADEAYELFQRYHETATNRGSRVHLMSIPVDLKRDADVRLSAFIKQAKMDAEVLEQLGELESAYRRHAACARARNPERAAAFDEARVMLADLLRGEPFDIDMGDDDG